MVAKVICGWSVFLLLIGLFAMFPAYSQEWSTSDVRGIKPGMTYSEVEEIVQKEWPDAKIRKTNNKVRILNETYEYGGYIEVRSQTESGTEKIEVQFMPPSSISSDAGSSTAMRINRQMNHRDRPLDRQSFVQALIKKYGEPTFQDVSNVKWMFDANQQLLTAEKLSKLISAKEAECLSQKKQIVEIQQNMRLSKSRGPNDLKELTQMQKSSSACNREAGRLRACGSNLQPEYCPYHLTFGWSPARGTEEFVAHYGVDVYGIPLDKKANERLQALREDLKDVAKRKTQERAISGSETKL